MRVGVSNLQVNKEEEETDSGSQDSSREFEGVSWLRGLSAFYSRTVCLHNFAVLCVEPQRFLIRQVGQVTCRPHGPDWAGDFGQLFSTTVKRLDGSR